MAATYQRLPLDVEAEKAEEAREHFTPAAGPSRRKLVLLGLVGGCVALGYLASLVWTSVVPEQAPRTPRWKALCSPLAFDQGQWISGTRPVLDSFKDVMKWSGYEVCKAEYQESWNFGVSKAAGGPYHAQEQPRAYTWMPHDSCRIDDATMVQKLQALVDSPVFLAGDSRTRQHLFQLSCELGEHVTWKGAKSPSDDNKAPHEWRYEQQHLFLDPKSPLVSQLHFPHGFDINRPIVSMTMAYTPQSRIEMLSLEGPGVNLDFVSKIPPIGVLVTEFDSNRTIQPFTSSQSPYKVMLFTTGAHFGPGTFFGNYQPNDIQALMRASLKVYYPDLLGRMRPDQRVLVRAALQAHTSCELSQERLFEVEEEGDAYNYKWMDELNRVLEAETKLVDDPRMQWIGLNRFSRLRPDAHLSHLVPPDCQHYAVGTGIYENINKYLWHVLLNP